jgi:hypothetical protein
VVFIRSSLSFLLGLLLMIGCTTRSPGEDFVNNAMPQLIGVWQKVSTSDCSSLYPSTLQFSSEQAYSGQPAPGQEFTLWDVGEYKVISDREIRISTANDAMPTYQYSLAGDILTFHDAENCEFQYRKVP